MGGGVGVEGAGQAAHKGCRWSGGTYQRQFLWAASAQGEPGGAGMPGFLDSEDDVAILKAVQYLEGQTDALGILPKALHLQLSGATGDGSRHHCISIHSGMLQPKAA